MGEVCEGLHTDCTALPSTGTRKHDANRPKTDYALTSNLDHQMGALQSAKQLILISHWNRFVFAPKPLMVTTSPRFIATAPLAATHQ